MELIQSFSVDHTKIIPGIYVSRIDKVGDYEITTYDIRMKRPNVEPAIDVAAMHSLEHIIATFLRNNDIWKDDIIYWGPMGCLTGFYLILSEHKGHLPSQSICRLMIEAFMSAAYAEEVPGATPINCGNYKLHNLELAKEYALEFAEYLILNQYNPLIYEYLKTERLMTDEGQKFFDS